MELHSGPPRFEQRLPVPDMRARRAGSGGRPAIALARRRWIGGGRRVSNREGEEKGAAASGSRLRPNAPTVSLDDPPAGGEADPAALVLAAAALEHLKDGAVLGQADPVVAHREGPAGVAVSRRRRHVRCIAVVKLEGVGNEVLKDPEQAGTACLQDRKRADLDAPVDAFYLGCQCREYLRHDLAAVDLGATRAVVCRGRVLEDAVDQTGSAFDAVVEKSDHLLLPDAEPAATAEQRGHDVHPEEWLAEVMRRYRGEVTQLVLTPALL